MFGARTAGATMSEHEKVRGKLRFPHEDSPIAQFLSRRIDELAPHKSQREIAIEAGYDKPNIMSMLKRGETKVPLERVPLLAKALECDPLLLFRLAMEQQSPEAYKIMNQLIGVSVTPEEFKVVRELRRINKNTNPRFTQKQVEQIGKAYRETLA